MTNYDIVRTKEIVNKNILFQGSDANRIKYCIREYISHLSQNNSKIFLLDSFWSQKKYLRYQGLRYRKEIERRYHIKLSVDDFMNKRNIFNYMNDKEINIMKIKSVAGYMSAAELFPVIISKINDDLMDQKAYIFINDFILECLSQGEFLDLYMKINNDKMKFFVMNSQLPLPEGLKRIIDEVIEID